MCPRFLTLVIIRVQETLPCDAFLDVCDLPGKVEGFLNARIASQPFQPNLSALYLHYPKLENIFTHRQVDACEQNLLAIGKLDRNLQTHRARLNQP